MQNQQLPNAAAWFQAWQYENSIFNKSVATTTSAAPATPTLGTLTCKPYVTDSFECCSKSWGTPVPSVIKQTAGNMVAQFQWGTTVDSTAYNITQTGKVVEKPGKGVQYMMNIGWQNGCTAYSSQYPDNPLGKSGDDTISYTTILEEIASNCKWYQICPVNILEALRIRMFLYFSCELLV